MKINHLISLLFVLVTACNSMEQTDTTDDTSSSLLTDVDTSYETDTTPPGTESESDNPISTESTASNNDLDSSDNPDSGSTLDPDTSPGTDSSLTDSDYESDTQTVDSDETDSDTEPPATFRNPLNTIRGSDPWMQYYDGHYYLTATTWSNQLTMKKATTLEGLKTAEAVVIWEETDLSTNHCCNMWAPEFFFLDGRWYYYYTAGRQGDNFDYQRMYVLESLGTDPLGPYIWLGQIYDNPNWWAIDGSVLEHNGNRYFMFSRWQGPNQCIFIARMSNPWTITGSATRISCPEYEWERHESNVNEAPEPLQRNGKTFIVYSASGCMSIEYKLGLLELAEGGDPMVENDWIKHSEPLFQWREEGNQGIYGPAHNGIFKSPDGTQWWHVYHANSNRNGGCYIHRTTRAQKINWNFDGTPDFGQPEFLNTDLVVPSGE